MGLFKNEMAEIYSKYLGVEPFCCICKRQLSSRPVYELSNGDKICGACSTTVTEPLTPCVDFEKYLRRFLFPCQFQKQGCDVLMRFNQASDHEDGCFYRRVRCPLLPNRTCCWKRTIPKLPKHFTRKHPELLTSQPEFKLQLGQSQERIAMVILSGFHVIFKYAYNAGTGKLQYDVRYFPSEVREVSCNTRVTNDSNCAFSIQFKEFVCSIYDIHFYHKKRCKTVDLNYYKELLGKPESVTVELDLRVQTPKEPKLFQEKYLKCDACKGRLVPPTFLCPWGIVCSSCRDKFADFKSSNDRKRTTCPKYKFLKNEHRHVTFRCCWPGCEYAGRDIDEHQATCECRVYECVEPECLVVFKWQDAVAHFVGHGHVYFTDECVFKIRLTDENREIKTCTVLSNQVVCFFFQVRHEKLWYRGGVAAAPLRRRFRMSKPEVKFKLAFQHKHCGVRSKTFGVFVFRRFGVRDLPRCFLSYEELTITANDFKIVRH